jgi:uncharacterized protein (PEP-CTERM system associated)
MSSPNSGLLNAIAGRALTEQLACQFLQSLGSPPFKRSLVWLGLACLPVMAQDATVVRALSVVPTFNASTAFTTVQGGGGNNSGELITRLGPGVQINQRSGRLQGSLDYSLLGTVHSRQGERNTVDQSLSASGKLEAVKGWAYVDAKANLGKVSLSPFGLQTATDSLSVNSEQRDVLTAYVSPYVRGELLGLAEYEVRLRGAGTEVRGTSFGDSNTLAASASLSSTSRGSRLGWGLSASQERVSFKDGRATDNARVGVSVSYRPDVDWLVTLRGGQESTNVGAFTNRVYDNWGGGLRWTPSTRTLVNVDVDRRYFGNSHQVTAEHRSKQSGLRFTSMRGSTSGADPTGLGQPTTLFAAYMRQFESVETDLQLRAIRVRELLRLTGQNGSAVVGGGFATSVISLQRRDDLTYTYTAARSTITAQAFSSSSEVLDVASRASPLNQGATKQVGLQLGLTHRTTPNTSVNLLGSYQRSTGSLTATASELKSLSLNMSTAMSRNTSATLGLRHSVYGGATQSNRESAITASLSMRF